MKQILLFFLLLPSPAFAQHNDVISCRGATIVATASPSTVTMTCQRADTLTSTICTTHSFDPVKIPPIFLHISQKVAIFADDKQSKHYGSNSFQRCAIGSIEDDVCLQHPRGCDGLEAVYIQLLCPKSRVGNRSSMGRWHLNRK